MEIFILKIPPSIDFAVTWFALSNGFWNPFLYWLLNARFRSISNELISSRVSRANLTDSLNKICSILQCFRRNNSKSYKSRCCSLSLECDHEIPMPPLPKVVPNRPTTITGNSHGTTTLTDFDGLSEKYWGEILERSFSSNSLHALQFNNHHQHNQLHPLYNQKHHFNNNTALSDINLNRSETNLYYSNSEPRLCDHDLHDINCAKNQAFFGAFEKNNGDI